MNAAGEDAQVRELIERGAEAGCVHTSDVDDVVRRLGLDEDAQGRLWSTLEERGIPVRDDCGRQGVASSTYAPDGLVDATADALSQLLREAGRHPLLTAAEEAELFQRIERGEGDARDRMVASNIRLVASIARRFQGYGLPLVDLIQEGVLGLMRAIDKFEWQRGYKFSTYATWWIRQSIQRGLANRAREIRVPLHIAERELQVSRLEQRLATELGRPPTDQEVSERSGIPLRQLEELRSAARTVTSLDRPLGGEEEGDTSLGQLMASPAAGPEEQVTVRLTREAVDEAVADLPELERDVVRLRYGLDGKEPRSAPAVSRELGISVDRVRTLERHGLAHLAEAREVRALRDAA